MVLPRKRRTMWVSSNDIVVFCMPFCFAHIFYNSFFPAALFLFISILFILSNLYHIVYYYIVRITWLLASFCFHFFYLYLFYSFFQTFIILLIITWCEAPGYLPRPVFILLI